MRTYGFEAICAGLVEMLKCQIVMNSEYKELQGRIERVDSLAEILQKKCEIECRQNEAEEAIS